MPRQGRKSQTGNTTQDAEGKRNWINVTDSSVQTNLHFQTLLLEKYNIRLKVSRGRFSYLRLERNKYITGRMLGTHYEEDYLRELFKENAEKKENKKKTVDGEKYNIKPEEAANQPSNLYCMRNLYQSFLSSQICGWWLICRIA